MSRGLCLFRPRRLWVSLREGSAVDTRSLPEVYYITHLFHNIRAEGASTKVIASLGGPSTHSIASRDNARTSRANSSAPQHPSAAGSAEGSHSSYIPILSILLDRHMTLYDDDVLARRILVGWKAVQGQKLAWLIGGQAWRFGLCCFAKGARGAGQEGLHCGRSCRSMVGKSQDTLRLLYIVGRDRRIINDCFRIYTPRP